MRTLLVCLLLASSASAAPITYHVDRASESGEGRLVGTITTDGTLGRWQTLLPIHTLPIVDWEIRFLLGDQELGTLVPENSIFLPGNVTATEHTLAFVAFADFGQFSLRGENLSWTMDVPFIPSVGISLWGEGFSGGGIVHLLSDHPEVFATAPEPGTALLLGGGLLLFAFQRARA